MMARTTIRDLREVSRREPCPICKHTGWCCVRTDGAVLCHRTPSQFPVKGDARGHWHNLPRPGEQTERVTWTPADFAPAPEKPVAAHPTAGLDTKHAVYTALLALCPLSPAHRAQLLGPGRQLPEEALQNYGTLPEGKAQTPILAKLVGQFGHETLPLIPGVLEDQNRPGGLRFNSQGGLMIPARDPAGRAQGMQVRADSGEIRYRWLSSTEGASSGTPSHTARPAVVTDQCIYLTEGPLKADIAASRLGAIVVGISGVSNWRYALPAVQTLRGEGHGHVIIALDADDPAGKADVVERVEAIRQEAAAALVGIGYGVSIARWDHSQGKGLDDLLLGGGTFTLEVYLPQIAPPGGGGGGEQGDDYAAGLEPGPLSDSKKLRILSNVLLNKHMKPVDKVTQCDIYLLTNTWPGIEEEEGTLGRRKPLLTLAARVNVGRNTISKSVGFLQDQGLTSVSIRTELPPPLKFPQPAAPPTDGAAPARPTPKSVAYFRPGRGLGFDEQLPEAEHRIKDRKRRCPACGSDRLIVHAVTCTRCGHRALAADAEKAAADYERARYAADQGETPPNDGCTDSEHAAQPDDGRTKTVHLYVEGEECTENVHAPQSADGCTDSEHAAECDAPPLQWGDDGPSEEDALTQALVRRLVAQTTLDTLSMEGRRIRATRDYTALSPGAQDEIRQAYEAHAQLVTRQGAA